MLTKDNNRSLHDPTQLALAVLVDRIGSLPKEDRDDLYELTTVLFRAEDDEARNAASGAMLESL